MRSLVAAMQDKETHVVRGLLVLAGGGLALGGIGRLISNGALQDGAWIGVTALTAVVVAVDIVRQLRRGRAGVDILALLTMAGALALGEFLAGAVIALMVASGRALEEHAGRRAGRALSALLARQPRTAYRYRGEEIDEIPLESVVPGDRLQVRAGEAVPVDGRLASSAAVIDEAALTGESLPVNCRSGTLLRSGVVNAGQTFDLEALAVAADSTYAGIVRLVREAQRGKAPFTRLADRYALWFIPLTLAVAAGAWIVAGSPVRALSVLVVATPCPLILAVPVAIVAGISLAARRGLLVKNGSALEALAQAKTAMFDKTGTLTAGTARVVGIETAEGTSSDEALRLAASLEQASQHVSARAIVAEASRRGLRLALPEDVSEAPGSGLAGRVEGRAIRAGSFEWLNGDAPPSDWARGVLRHMAVQGRSGVFVEVDGTPCAALLLADDLRLDTARALRELHNAGIRRTVMVSGDRQDVAETIAFALGIDTVLAECAPEDKVEAVETERARAPTVMVGDGINDAPALAAADVGVAMGARGAAASAEAADAVLLVDRLDRLAEGMLIARRSRSIALQSVFAGMSLSLVAMGFAAAGFIAPVYGALLQELIDVAVILNALRALQAPRGTIRRRVIPKDVVQKLRVEHDHLMPFVDRIDSAARALNGPEPAQARPELETVGRMLRTELLPHERGDEEDLYPRLAGVLRGFDPLAAMSRTHREIFHLARLYSRLLEDLPPGPIPDFELGQLRRLLYSLGAILRLHFAQEEELFQAVAPE